MIDSNMEVYVLWILTGIGYIVVMLLLKYGVMESAVASRIRLRRINIYSPWSKWGGDTKYLARFGVKGNNNRKEIMEMARGVKESALKVARELCYSRYMTDVTERIKASERESEITEILHECRRRWMEAEYRSL